MLEFQSTLPGWGATDAGARVVDGDGISIHAPRMGSDLVRVRADLVHVISIHAPRMGSDCHCRRPACSSRYFNPRSQDGERPQQAGQQHRPGQISIHAPRMGSDRTTSNGTDKVGEFQSTFPGWGATPPPLTTPPRGWISIHVPRVGSDFNSAAPLLKPFLFQSTFPGWGATAVLPR